MKTFVVIAIRGQYEDETQTVVYAGQDEEKAFSTNLDNNEYLGLQVWVIGIHLKKYTKKDIYNFIISYDKIDNVQKEFEKHTTEASKYKEKLAELKTLLDDWNN